MVDLFSWYFQVNSCILRGLFIESSLMVNLLPCASLTVSQKLHFLAVLERQQLTSVSS